METVNGLQVQNGSGQDAARRNAPGRAARRPLVLVGMAFVAAGILGLAGVWLFFHLRTVNETRLVPFALEYQEQPPTLDRRPANAEPSELRIVSVSTDGRWAYLASVDRAVDSGEADDRPAMLDSWFFDLKSRKFLAKAQWVKNPGEGIIYAPVLTDNWTPEDILFRKCVTGYAAVGFGLLRQLAGLPLVKTDVYFYSIDAVARKGALLYQTQAPEPMGGFYLDEIEAVINPTGSRIAVLFNLPGGQTLEIGDIDSGKKPWKPTNLSAAAGNRLKLRGWLADDRTLVIWEETSRSEAVEPFGLSRLAVLDAEEKAVRWIDGLRETLEWGGTTPTSSSPSLALCYLDVLSVHPDWRCARLIATLRAEGDWPSSPALHTYIYDVHLDAEQLLPVRALAEPDTVYRDSCILSPSLELVLIALPREPLREEPEPTTAARAILVMHGRRRILPIGVYPLGTTELDGNVYPSIRGAVAFADENTLIYTTPQYELWKFDLATSEAERLWAGPQPAPGRLDAEQ